MVANQADYDISFNLIQLAAHNKYRADHGVPPMTLDKDLAKEAQLWANELNKTKKFIHKKGLKGIGENLAKTSDPKLAVSTSFCTDSWYDEIAKYNFDKPGFSQETGHFT